MENKDLNTFFKNGTEDGNGIPYKEAYWEKMNTLLDEQMPVKNTAAQSAVPAKTIKRFRFFQILSALSVTTVVLLVAFYPKSTPQPVSTTAAASYNESPILEEKASPSFSSAEEENPVAGQNNQANEVRDQADRLSSEKQQKVLSTPNLTAENHLPLNNTERSISSLTKQDKNSYTDPLTPPDKERSISPSTKQFENDLSSFIKPETKPEFISTENTSIQYQPDQKLIELATNQFLSVPDKSTDKSSIHPDHIAFRGQHAFIRQLSVSPYVGIIHSVKGQDYTTSSIRYQNNPQTNLAYGVNLNITTKRFSIRTSVGMSRTTIHSSYETERPVYRYDTSYTIIDYHYDTTQSGHPVALVRQQIDSSLIAKNAKTITSTIQYQYITIPLTIQYRFAHKRISLMAEAGALNNFRVSSEVRSSSDRHLRIPTYQMQLTLGSGAMYALNSTCEIGVQYNYAFSQQAAGLVMLNNAHAVTLLFNYRLR